MSGCFLRFVPLLAEEGDGGGQGGGAVFGAAAAFETHKVRVAEFLEGTEAVRVVVHVTVFTGTREILNPDSVKLFERLDRDGTNELVLREGMFHVYPLLPIPEAGPALDRIVEIIEREAPGA